MSFIKTFSGKHFYYDRINKDDIVINDIAISLSNICRFAGHLSHFYSVAQHAVLCSQLVPQEFAFEALMHDATEAYCQDNLPLSELTPDYIAAWLSTERQNRPTVTAHAYRLLRAFIKWSNYQKKYQGIIPGDLAQDYNVRKMVPVSASKADDCLQKEQLKSWFSAVRSLNNPIASAYLQVLLLTGARREEIASLRWSDVDFKWSSMRIKDKIEGERIIPLTPYVSELLNVLAQSPNSDVNKEGWVFRSNSKSGKIIEPRSAHNRALVLAELPHISLHGLRRSFGTLAEWVEVPTGIVAQIMGHKPSALAEKHYRRRPLDLLRKWHEKIETWILNEAGITIKNNVDMR